MTDTPLFQIEGRNIKLGDGAGDLSFALQAQEIVALVGLNGAGKSSFLSACAGIGNDEFARHLNGENIPHPSKSVQFIFQSDNLYPWLTIRQNVDLVRGNSDGATTDEILSDIGVAGLADKYPKTLSGGEKKLIEIARAIASKGEVLLLDEPFAALDLHYRKRVQGVIANALKKQFKSIVIVTHDIPAIMELCNRMVLMKKTDGHFTIENIDIDQSVDQLEAFVLG